MKILLSNDDGVQAEGIGTLAEFLRHQGHKVVVIAPDRDRSGASHSLTLDRPLHPIAVGEDTFCLNGTPADCVHLGLQCLCPEEPDIVIAGINSGANLGDDVIYSGTVAAAMEGRFLVKNPIAISLVGHKHYETAACFLVRCLPQLAELRLARGVLININVPDLPDADILGYEITRLGHRDRADCPVAMTNPRGKQCYWISGAGQGQDAGLGTDFFAISQSKISVTPIQVDMTAYSAQARVAELLSPLQESLHTNKY